MNRKIGVLKKEILNIFNIKIEQDLPILIGDKNIEHIKSTHANDYKKYGDKISEIIKNPTYVAKHPKKTSVEYIKEFLNDDSELVLVAVRITQNKTAFVKTLFVMSDEKKKKYIKRWIFEKSN